MHDNAFDNLENKPKGAKGRFRVPLELIVIVALLSGLYWWLGRSAPTPTLFGQSVSLDEAMASAEAEDKIVFAYATASWCTPCQQFKRGALSDERVIDWMEANAVPVYIDIDENPNDAMRLGVRPIPASFIIADGKIVDTVVGPVGAKDFVSWLESTRARSGRVRLAAGPMAELEPCQRSRFGLSCLRCADSSTS